MEKTQLGKLPLFRICQITNVHFCFQFPAQNLTGIVWFAWVRLEGIIWHLIGLCVWEHISRNALNML